MVEIVNGNGLANTLLGDQNPADLDDRLNGFGGNDTLVGGGGDNELNGGPGNDTADYSRTSDFFGPPANGVDVDLAAGTANPNAFGGMDTLSDVENVIGTDFADTIRGDDDANRLEGRGGGDTLEGRGGADTLLGEAGADSLSGGAGNDSLNGGAADDTLVGGAGADTATGGAGNDTFRFGSGDLAPFFPLTGPFDRITDFEGAGVLQNLDPADEIVVDTATNVGLAFVNPAAPGAAGTAFTVLLSDGLSFLGVLEVVSVNGNPPQAGTDIFFV